MYPLCSGNCPTEEQLPGDTCKGYPARGNIDDRMWFRYEGCKLGVKKWENGDEINDGMTFTIPLRERLNYIPMKQWLLVAGLHHDRRSPYHRNRSRPGLSGN